MVAPVLAKFLHGLTRTTFKMHITDGKNSHTL
jgi:hypothetical protein